MSEQEIRGLLESLSLRLDAIENTVEQVASNTVEMLSRWEKKKEELSSDEMLKINSVLQPQTDVSFHALLDEDKKVKTLPPVPRKPVKIVSQDLVEQQNTITFDSSPAARPIGVTVRGGASVRGVTVRGGVSARGVSVRGGVAARGRLTTQ